MLATRLGTTVGLVVLGVLLIACIGFGLWMVIVPRSRTARTGRIGAELQKFLIAATGVSYLGAAIGRQFDCYSLWGQPRCNAAVGSVGSTGVLVIASVALTAAVFWCLRTIAAGRAPALSVVPTAHSTAKATDR